MLRSTAAFAVFAILLAATIPASAAPDDALVPPCSTVATCVFSADDPDALARSVTAAWSTDVASNVRAEPIPVLAYASHAVSSIVDAAGDVAAGDAEIVDALLGAPAPYAAFGRGDTVSARLTIATRRPIALATDLPRF